MMARRGSGDMAPLSLNLGDSWRLVVNIKLRPFYPRGRKPIPIEVEAGWASGQFWEWLEMIYSPTGIHNPDRPARSLVTVVTELRRTAYCLINVLILGSMEEFTSRKQNVSLTFIIPSPSCSLPSRGNGLK